MGNTVIEGTTVEYMEGIQRRILNAAAESASFYNHWGAEFCCKEVQEAWTDKRNRGTNWDRRITVEELRAVPRDTLYRLGFANWNGATVLLPLWVWHYIADGEELVRIDDTRAIKGADAINLDVRMGAIAYGFVY